MNTVKFLYSIILIVFFTKRFWGVDFPWYLNILCEIAGILLMLAIKRGKIRKDRTIKINLVLFAVPIIFNFVYTFVLWMFSGFPSEDIVRNLFTTQSTYFFIHFLFMSSVVMLFGKESVYLSVACASWSYIIGSVLGIVVRFGLGSTISYLLTASSANKELGYYMEVHDLTFAFGLFFLYLLFNEEKSKRRNRYLVICALMIFWGFKRIEIAALLVCLVCYKAYISKINPLLSSKTISIVIMVVNYLYIMLIHNDFIANLATKYNINFMGRLEAYNFVAKRYSEFSPFFWGKGVGYIDELISVLQEQGVKAGNAIIIPLHSDTLRMYIGLGFICFGLWVFYQTYMRPSILYKHFTDSTVKFYIVIMVYMFILYLTDNTYSFALTNAALFQVVVCSCELRTRKRE